jgi:hypothetical protein
MSQSKLFDYNSSFAVTRTNPKLAGNFKITVDSSGGVWFNSQNVNQILSQDKYKKFNISGDNTYASDINKFFDDGKLSSDIIFQVGKFTNGENQSAQQFPEQYDFFYASGAQALIDKNYGEDFSYFAPLWVKNEIPDFFVIFKVSDPLDYPYSKNVTVIEENLNYIVIQDYTSTENFQISYGKDSSGNDLYFNSGQVFKGKLNISSYQIISGSGKVAVYDELYYLPEVQDVKSTFNNKILNKATAIKTFDLRENTKIGKYIRSIFNNPGFSKSPLEVSWGYDSYTYFKGASISEGVYTKKGELLNDYFSTSASDGMIDIEDYLTSGFSRNGIICPNLLNLEFLFNDDESDLYTINRYLGFYVSRNDVAQFRMNGQFFYEYRNLEGNENLPKPTRNDFGYYYNNYTSLIGATSGVRLFYENASGFLPGSDSVNILDNEKLFYVTDKNDNFYSLKRSEDYLVSGVTGPEYSYGPYNYSTEKFSATGSTGATAGSLVIQNTQININSFTGTEQKIATVPAERPISAGRGYIDIKFLNPYNQPQPLTLKLYWPNGSQKEGSRNYDIIKSGDFSSILIWTAGSYYSTGNSYYFNASTGSTSDIASALASVIKDLDQITLNSGQDEGSSIICVKNPGEYSNSAYSLSIFDNYDLFQSSYKGVWNNTSSYSIGDIVSYMGYYYEAQSSVIPPTGGMTNSPDANSSWSFYYTFSTPGLIEINDIDASLLKENVNFVGGTKTINTRIIFSVERKDQVQVGNYIKTEQGYSQINSVTRYIDEPKLDANNQVIGFNNFSYLLVANVDENNSIISLGSDQSFNVYKYAQSSLGVFTFFDVKEFDFDFWSSNYNYTPNPETYKYFQIQPNVEGVIEPNIPYFISRGQINYAGNIYNQGNLFFGATGYTSFTVSDPSLNTPFDLILQSQISFVNSQQTPVSSNVVVFPAQYSNVTYNASTNSYENIGYQSDLESFNGFIGIQGILLDPPNVNPTKEEVFSYGKLKTEYEYLKENYTVQRSNISRIVPYINKWASSLGTDSRGNRYRLNVSPAFSPTNFSPSFDKMSPDPKYLTHEWFLLENPPRYFPVDFMNEQNSYLPGPIDLDKARSVLPEDNLYLSSYFTVEPADYDAEYRDDNNYTKELFTNFEFDQASGYYETIFRGCKIVLKKRSDVDPQGLDESDKYVRSYRGYEDYKFSALLRAVEQDDITIQPPVKYQVIENTEQKFVLFVCDIVIREQRAFNLGVTGATGTTGPNPTLDYTFLYSVDSKTKAINPPENGKKFTVIDDIKLSCSLDLSLGSFSFVNENSSPGLINISRNSEYDTDLREEIHVFYVENSSGITGPSPTGKGSFTVPSISCNYPWPTGVGPSYVEFGKVSTGSNYTFSIPFSLVTPNTVPVGPSSVYRNKPVFQKEGGDSYYKSIMGRISVGYISERFNQSSPYISYKTYDLSGDNQETITSNAFELYFEKPTKITKITGSTPVISFNGPQSLNGARNVTGYQLIQNNRAIPSIMIRYSGNYEPLTRKIIHFDRDKTDTLIGSDDIDLSFRNCNFAPGKKYFGISRNLNYTKVSLGRNILSTASQFPEGARYPYVGITPIDFKDFNVFSSSWDQGYYDRYDTATRKRKVAGTRGMKEYKTFFGSKVMQTPDPVAIKNYITLQVSRTTGENQVSLLNSQILDSVKTVQEINQTTSGTGIGSFGPYLSGVDLNKLDQNIFPNVEIFWQWFSNENKIKGVIRLDRMLRRFLLNSGIKQVFVDNMITQFGVGDPNSINDDVNEYIDLNVSPIYQCDVFNLFVKKTANSAIPTSELVRGDIAPVDTYKMGYFEDENYKLTKQSNLIYEFEYSTEVNFYYSILFNFSITKI